MVTIEELRSKLNPVMLEYLDLVLGMKNNTDDHQSHVDSTNPHGASAQPDSDTLVLRDGSGDIAAKHLLLSSSPQCKIGTTFLAANRVHSIPDAGADAEFVMSKGNQSIGGAKIFTEIAKYNEDKSFTTDQDLVSKKYVDLKAESEEYSFARGWFQGNDFRSETVGNIPSDWAILTDPVINGTLIATLDGHNHVYDLNGSSYPMRTAGLSITGSIEEFWFYTFDNTKPTLFGTTHNTAFSWATQISISSGRFLYRANGGSYIDLHEVENFKWYHFRIFNDNSTRKQSVWINRNLMVNNQDYHDTNYPSNRLTVQLVTLQDHVAIDAVDLDTNVGYFVNRNYPSYLTEGIIKNHLPKSGGIMNGNIDMGGNQITGLPLGWLGHHAARYDQIKTAHSQLNDLWSDDHLHYHTDERGDARYKLPIGTVLMYAGTWVNNSTILGWYMCDGNNGTPNLSGKFIRGATTSGGSGGGTSGAASGNTDNSAAFNSGAGGTGVTDWINHNHQHDFSHGHGTRNYNSVGSVPGYNTSLSANTGYVTSNHNHYGPSHQHSVGAHAHGLGSHTHSISTPPYYDLIFIQRRA